MFGDKCSYIHPNIPCKYGFYCTRIGCSYSHPAGWNPGMAMYPNIIHSMPIKPKKKHPEGKDNPTVEQQGNQDVKVEENNNQVQAQESVVVAEENTVKETQ